MSMILFLGIYGAINFKMKKLHKVYNLGNSKPESLLEFIKTIEKNLNKKAKKNYLSLQPGDVPATFADISESTRILNFCLKQNKRWNPRFIEWFKNTINFCKAYLFDRDKNLKLFSFDLHCLCH